MIQRAITRHWRVLLAAVCFAVLSLASYTVWKARKTLGEVTEKVASESAFRFDSGRLERTLPAGLEALGAPSEFRDAVLFQNGIWAAGPQGLFQFGTDGSEMKRYRAGGELPAAPISALSVAAVSGSAGEDLWIATLGEGLVAFDGSAFRSVRPLDARLRKITALLGLATGRLVFGTEKAGVLVFDGHSIAPFHPSLANLHVTALAGDDSHLWIGTVDRGLLEWRAGELRGFGEAEGLPDRHVLSIAAEGDRAWAGTAMGVGECSAGKYQRTLARGVTAQAIAVRAEALLIGTLDEGVVTVPLTAGPPRPAGPASATAPRRVNRFVSLQDGLYAVAPDGIFAGEPAGWRRVLGDSRAAMLSDRNVSALSIDPGGRLWVGYFDRGLDIADPSSGRARHTEDEHVFCVNRIVHDRDRGLTAVATANGLVLFDSAGNQRQVLGKADGLIADHVTDVLVRPGGFVAATPAGISIFDTAGARSLYAFHGLVNNHVYALAARDRTLMAGTLGGLSVVEDGLVRAAYTTANSRLRHNWITAIVPDGSGWLVGTYGAGVLAFDANAAWNAFGEFPPDLIVNPGAMLATRGSVYAGSLGQGLWRRRSPDGRWTNIMHGLPSTNVTALASGGGFVYIGTDNGLVRVPEDNIE